MHLPGFLVQVLHLLGIGTGSDSDTTTISTVDGYFSSRLTTPVAFHPSAFEQHSTTVSPKFISTLASTYSTAEEIIDRSKMATGNTREFRTTEHGVSSTTFGPTVTDTSSPASETAETGGSTTTSGTTETGSNTETDHTEGSTTTSGTTETGSNTETDPTGQTDGNTTITGSTEPDTTVTGSTEPDTTVTGSSEPDTTVTGSAQPDTTVSGKTVPDTTVSGGSTVTGHTGSPTSPSGPPPTDAPGLSRGAVAGIVIGCLLLVAVVAAAVVFFMKNRNIPPEAQRLRV